MHVTCEVVIKKDVWLPVLWEFTPLMGELRVIKDILTTQYVDG